MQFTDASVVAGTRRRDDGYLVADVRIARTGMQTYLGSEVGKPDMAVVRVYRPGAEVFSEDTIKSAAHRPVTNDHPADMVTSKNWRKHAVGQTGDEVAGEGIYLRVPLMVSDEAAIKDIEGGKREVSAGYTCDLDWTAGTTPSGEAYDAIQKNIRLNHVAIVQRGRAGSEVRIGDGAANWGASPIPTADERKPSMTDLRTVMVDGLSVSATDQAAQAIEKLLGERKEARDAIGAKDTAHATALAAKDGEIAKRDALVDDLKAKVLTDADIDKRVQARADLITVARAIHKDVKIDGLTDAAIRKAVVEAKVGADAIKDKADAYVDARFDILAEAAVKDGGKAKVADPFRPTNDVDLTDASAAHARMIADMQSAWSPASKKDAA